MEEEKNKRKSIILTIIAVVTILILVIGATYAYFQARIDEGTSANVDVKTGTVDDLTFSLNDIKVDTLKDKTLDSDNNKDIVIKATQDNFKEGATDIADGVSGQAILIANDENYTASEEYNVYLNITKNELEYSSYKNETGTKVFTNALEKEAGETEGYTPIPELYLTIRKNGEEVTSGVTLGDKELTYTPNVFNLTSDGTQVGGFDITEAKGLIKIEVPATISIEGNKENHTKTDEWEITITFVNLATDQNLNTGKSLVGKVMIQSKEYVPTLADLCTGEKASECFTKNYKNDKALIYHNATAASEDKIENAEKIAGDDSYRYSGSNDIVHNYVCFGSACSNEGDNPNYKNLYRIIGFFKNEDDTSDDYGKYEMKIIKADAATKEDLGEGTFPESAYRGEYKSSNSSFKSYYKGQNWDNIALYSWNDTAGTESSNNNVNMWAASNLNTKNLNGTYYDAMNPTYQSMVVEHKWEVGAAWSSGDAKAVYDHELGDYKLTSSSNNCYTQGSMTARECNLENDLTYKDEVGLMYKSDYMYGTLPDYWTTAASNYTQDDVKNNDWLYLGIGEWTISRHSNYGHSAWEVNPMGNAGNYNSVYHSRGVRPVLYLTSDVKIIDGSGTDSDPFTLAM